MGRNIQGGNADEGWTPNGTWMLPWKGKKMMNAILASMFIFTFFGG